MSFSDNPSFIETISKVVDEKPYQGQLRLFLKAMEGIAQSFELPLKPQTEREGGTKSF